MLHTTIRLGRTLSAQPLAFHLHNGIYAALAQKRFLSDKARAVIDSAVRRHPVVLFMKGTPEMPQCGFSRAVIQILDLHDVSPSKMQTYNVLADPELRTGIKEYSDWPTIPQLYVNGEFVGGCDIVMSMHQNGELATVLDKVDRPTSSPA